MIRLNVGSGDQPAAAPWINVDQWHGVNPDVLASADSLPFDDGSVSRLYCGHLVEHVDPLALGAVFAEFRRVLEPGGLVCIVGPDYRRAIDAGDTDPVLLGCIRDGGDRWPGDRHLWVATESLAVALMRPTFPNAEPVNIADTPTEWPVAARVWWQFAILATKET